MAEGSIAGALRALTTGKGAVLGGVAAFAVVSLLNIGADHGGNGSPLISASPAMAQAPVQAPVQAQVQAQPPIPMTDRSGAFTPSQVQALHGIIKDYLVANPEIIVEVSKELERKQAAEQAMKQERFMSENKAQIFKAAGDFVLGNAKGDVTVIEFFDYNCGWCKRAVDDLNKLTKADPKVRVVMKEYPIFGGPDSVLAAKAASASIKQNKYWEFHTALMREKQVTAANLFTVAQRVGLDVARLKTDMADPKIEKMIEENIKVGQELGIEGTPGFVLDNKVNVGYVNADGMQKMLSEIRKSGCKIC